MKKICYLFIALTFITISTVNAQGGVAINVAGALPDSSAVLDVSSFTKGQLMPRMSTVQRDAIARPATGLFIFNTDCDVVNYNAGTPASPNWATMSASNVLTAGVSITASPAGAICAGTSVTFSATPSQNNLSPTYHWKVNGSNVGTNSATYTSTNLTSGDVVTCVLTSSAACVTGSPATSNAITMLVNLVPTITGSTSTGFCTGSAVTLSASANIGTINWYNVSTGGSSLSTGASFTVAGLNATTTYYVDATANGCTSASRTAVTATFYPNGPGQPGAITGPISVDRDSLVNYSVTPLPNTASYAWTVNLGIITSGQGTNSINVTWGDSLGLGSVSVAAINPCGTSSSQSIVVGVQTFYYNGAQQTFTVPTGVTSRNITCYGAQGGNGNGSNGGLGGMATGTLSVTPGSQLFVYVGGQSGFNGGGIGGQASFNGGDETDIRQGGTAYNNWILVAGGGGGGSNNGGYGGGGGSGSACANGAGGGGGTTGSGSFSTGGPGNPGTCTNGGTSGASQGGWSGGGGGGGLTSGGDGSGGGGYGNAGGTGTQGVGGNYGTNTGCNCCGTNGCGGGGGYYGGGGTSAGQCAEGSGGGGSSWASNVLTNVSFTGGVRTGTGLVQITW